MDRKTFLGLSTSEIAQLVHEGGLKVCVFPINGTRRWYALEHGDKAEQSAQAYIALAREKHLQICRMIFDHGVETLLTPTFGTYVQQRGERYMRLFTEYVTQLTAHPDYLSLYNDFDVRVRFYGDYRKHLTDTPYGVVCEQFDSITSKTLHNGQHRLFYGVFAHDAAETAAELAVHYYQLHGRVPNKAELVEMYYGEPVPPVDLFIGFSKFRAFDMPLLTNGRESLYFTVSPSLYFNETQLREILYDFLFARRTRKTDYAALSAQDRVDVKNFYHQNIGRTLGVGTVHSGSGLWYPLPQVELTERFEHD
jgi:tuberculosinol/isotuberculosinol synthase